MKENFLSQAEVDALLKKRNAADETGLKDSDKDVIGEVGNITMSTAATTLSSIINHRVSITTPRVSYIPFEEIIDDCEIPKVVSRIEFKEGLIGNNLLMMNVRDSAIIADLMMGGDGSNANSELTELELSAVAEAMNQMIGSASTSMAQMLGKNIDILPPDVSVWDKKETVDYKKFIKEDYICKISFHLSVEGLIESDIMQLYTLDTVKEIVDIMMGDVSSERNDSAASVDTKQTAAVDSIREAEMQGESKTVNEIPIQPGLQIEKPVFANLEDTSESNQNRNLDLIMDVPLEFSVVLGKTKKTIQDILALGTGSVVELNKLADEPLEVYVNGKLIAHGEVVVINENFGIRITQILSREQRVKGLK
ncbi:flagellar motor switch phosphatase FliY [Alkalibacter mobilis]|uniref:flagellar motor switch phosphatase FliY n=1 Tax=Alkalibacter mobilis TaxID=2787712 RepID=UPI00189E1948|nr:flagellar motor switch phosphatase FliY [Alkalibacter mobilis]MBF7096338.1 flagellar motor switch phosphatase FliY [Alkalibacter mobilis]